MKCVLVLVAAVLYFCSFHTCAKSTTDIQRGSLPKLIMRSNKLQRAISAAKSPAGGTVALRAGDTVTGTVTGNLTHTHIALGYGSFISGPTSGTFTGTLTGTVTGTNNVTGRVTGSLSVDNSVRGGVYGSFTGPVSGNVTVTSTDTGRVTCFFNGEIRTNILNSRNLNNNIPNLITGYVSNIVVETPPEESSNTTDTSAVRETSADPKTPVDGSKDPTTPTTTTTTTTHKEPTKPTELTISTETTTTTTTTTKEPTKQSELTESTETTTTTMEPTNPTELTESTETTTTSPYYSTEAPQQSTKNTSKPTKGKTDSSNSHVALHVVMFIGTIALLSVV